MVYFAKKNILHDVATTELVLPSFGNFIGNHREIIQVA